MAAFFKLAYNILKLIFSYTSTCLLLLPLCLWLFHRLLVVDLPAVTVVLLDVYDLLSTFNFDVTAIIVITIGIF